MVTGDVHKAADVHPMLACPLRGLLATDTGGQILLLLLWMFNFFILFMDFFYSKLNFLIILYIFFRILIASPNE